MPNKNTTIDIQGHRGCRGTYPENTIKGFIKALDMGVSTLEMDLVINVDKEVVVSHEPYFSNEIAIDPTGKTILKEEEEEHNIFQLNTEAIKKYDVGLKPHDRFPNQEKAPEHKSLLKEVFHAVQEHCQKNNLAIPDFNIEIKRKKKWDNIFHPQANEFVDIVVKEVRNSGFLDKIVIQCFDFECLRILHEQHSDIKLSLLIDNNRSIKENIETLGFIPDVYSPYFILINRETVSYCQAKEIKLIPWTVNEKEEINELIYMGVDGIISDFPATAIQQAKELNLTIASSFIKQ